MDAELIDAIADSRDTSVLVTVLKTRGSVPRHAGSKMLIGIGRPQFGTVGGGRLEAAALAAAGECALSGRSTRLEVEMVGEAALGSEMICGGSSLLLVERLSDPAPYLAAKSLLGIGRRALLVKRIVPVPDSSDCVVSVSVLDERCEIIFGGGEGLDKAAARESLSTGKSSLSGDGGIFCDPLMPEEKLIILGAGHVGLALARLASGLDFSVTVVDDRPGMLELGRFPPEVAVLRSGYAEAITKIPFDPSTYAVVLTRGHIYDLDSVRALLGREYRYAGMIGSARKTKLIFEQLRAEGFDPARIEALCAPVGLDIDAETPEEIAVCILAEMIAFRRNAKSLESIAVSRILRRDYAV